MMLVAHCYFVYFLLSDVILFLLVNHLTCYCHAQRFHEVTFMSPSLPDVLGKQLCRDDAVAIKE